MARSGKPARSGQTIAERESVLWKVEAEDAIHLVDWMYRFSQLCGCAQKAQSEEDRLAIIGILREINPGRILNIRLRLMQMLQRRLELERDALALSRERSRSASLSTGKRGRTDLKAKALAEYGSSGLGPQQFAKDFANRHPQCEWGTVKKWIDRASGGT